MKQSREFEIRLWIESHDPTNEEVMKRFSLSSEVALELRDMAISVDLSGLTEKKKAAIMRSREIIATKFRGEKPGPGRAYSIASVSPGILRAGGNLGYGNKRTLKHTSRLMYYDED